jgi:hypothetical protein
MNRNDLTVGFHVEAYKSKRGLELPREIARLLRVHSQSKKCRLPGAKCNHSHRVALRIASLSNGVLFHGIAPLASGTEITDKAACKGIKPGEQLYVTAGLPPQ